MEYNDLQLSLIVKLFKKFDVNYCIDSGSLLGLVRDGKFMDHDKDIDISVTIEELSKIDQIAQEFKQEGYRVRVLDYSGHVYKYKLSSPKEKRIIDINIFRYNEARDIYWCPQPVPYFLNSKSIRKYSWRYIFFVLFEFYKNYFERSKLNSIPWKWAYEHKTWSIPSQFFNNLKEESELIYPKNVNDYLTFRYGDWKVPNTNWNFITDDGGLLNNKPDELIEK